MSAYDAAYFQNVYRDYRRQSSFRKWATYARLAEPYLDPRLPRSWRDWGCAQGECSGALAERGWTVDGVDGSEWAIERARARYPHLRFHRHPIEREIALPTVSVASAFDVLEHLADPDAAVPAIRSTLAPGGRFLFVVPVYDGVGGRMVRALDRDPTHRQRWPRARWLTWAARHFTLIDWTGLVRYLTPFGYLHFSTRWARVHSPAIFVVCGNPSGIAAS